MSILLDAALALVGGIIIGLFLMEHAIEHNVSHRGTITFGDKKWECKILGQANGGVL